MRWQAGGPDGSLTPRKEPMAIQVLDDPLPIPPFEMRQLVGPTDEAAFDDPSGDPILQLPESQFNSVLDFGCGCGRLARQMMQQRARPRRYVGFDLHLGMVCRLPMPGEACAARPRVRVPAPRRGQPVVQPQVRASPPCCECRRKTGRSAL
jgi:SAM-dependent methyltransferase